MTLAKERDAKKFGRHQNQVVSDMPILQSWYKGNQKETTWDQEKHDSRIEGLYDG
jgi:hypothetical protein